MVFVVDVMYNTECECDLEYFFTWLQVVVSWGKNVQTMKRQVKKSWSLTHCQCPQHAFIYPKTACLLDCQLMAAAFIWTDSCCCDMVHFLPLLTPIHHVTIPITHCLSRQTSLSLFPLFPWFTWYWTICCTVLSALRVYALWQGSKMKYIFSAVVFILGAVPVATNIVGHAFNSYVFLCWLISSLPGYICRSHMWILHCTMGVLNTPTYHQS